MHPPPPFAPGEHGIFGLEELLPHPARSLVASSAFLVVPGSKESLLAESIDVCASTRFVKLVKDGTIG